MNGGYETAARKNEEHLGEVYAFARRRGMMPAECATHVLAIAAQQLGSTAYAVFCRLDSSWVRESAGPDARAQAQFEEIERTVCPGSLSRSHPSTLAAMTQDGPAFVVRVPFESGQSRRIAALAFSKPIATSFTPSQQRYFEFLSELLAQCYGGSRPVQHEPEYLLCYQPICKSGGSRAIARAEALLRWVHPERGIIGPAALFERNGTAAEEAERLDEYVIESCANEWIALRQQGIDISLHVNISRTSDDTLNMLARKSRLAEGGGIVVEIAEAAVYKDLGALHRFVQRCHELGFRVGLGAAEDPALLFPALSTLPVDFVKLSMNRPTRSENGTSFAIRGAIELAKHRNVAVIVDHVETERDVTTARELGADYLQGYAVAPPMTRHDLLHWSLNRGGSASARPSE